MERKKSADDDCPFSYKPGEEPPRVEHEIIGKCVDCGSHAYVLDNGIMRCWPCAYSAASW